MMLSRVPALASLPDERAVEAIHEEAHRLADTPESLPRLLEWASRSPRSHAALLEEAMSYGIPEPDYDADGEPVCGSVLGKLLAFAQTFAIVNTLEQAVADHRDDQPARA